MEMFKVCSLTLKLPFASEHAADLPKYTCTLYAFITEDDIRWPHAEVMNWRDAGH